MAIIFMDGFDHYTNIISKWTGSNNASIGTTGGRRNGGVYNGNNFHYCYKTLPTSATTMIAGCAFKPNGTGASRAILNFCEGVTTQHVTLSYESSGKITARRGNDNGTILGTGLTVLTSGIFYYIECKVTVNATTGYVEVRVNGVLDLQLSNQNTRNGGTVGTIDTFQIGQSNGAGDGTSGSYDDLYVCDTTGPSANDFLGDCRIDTLFPNGDGNYQQFSLSTGTSHFANVNKTAPAATPYNFSSTVAQRDSYAFTDLPGLTSQIIYGVQINAAATKSDSGTRSVGTMSRLGGVDKDGAGTALSTSQLIVSEIQHTDPVGTAWTEANVNAAEFGVKVTL